MPASSPQALISEAQIAARVQELAAELDAALPPGPLTVVSVLRGAFMFTADLVRHLPRDLRLEFLAVRSYGDATESSGVVEIVQDLQLPVNDRHVLLVEDIVDTGLTLKYLRELFATKGAASVTVCSLLSKPSRRKVDVAIDFVGFEIEDQFVVGYGLDAAQRFRNLPYIAELQDE